jgi:hypothetical protein
MTEIEKIEIQIKYLELKILNFRRHPEREYDTPINDINYLISAVNTLIHEYYLIKMNFLSKTIEQGS